MLLAPEGSKGTLVLDFCGGWAVSTLPQRVLIIATDLSKSSANRCHDNNYSPRYACGRFFARCAPSKFLTSGRFMTAFARPNRVLNWVVMALGMAIGQLLLSNAAGAEQDIPRPEQVFRYVAKAEGDKIIVSYTIAPNHYLYRSRMSFATDTAGVTLGAPIFPAGKIHDDENFGRQEVYYDQAIIAVPFTIAGPRPKTLALTLKLQGCTEKLGICCPPQKWVTDVAVGAGAATATDPLSFGKSRAKTAAGDLLPVDQAFQVSAE